jgi:sulfur relay (sulfurtransferase) DsrC/TusE family protein
MVNAISYLTNLKQTTNPLTEEIDQESTINTTKKHWKPTNVFLEQTMFNKAIMI